MNRVMYMFGTPVHSKVTELALRPQPEQKSVEWHNARRAALTASDVASALPRDECALREYIAEFSQWMPEPIKFSNRASMNPYETRLNLVLKKLGSGKPFTGNTATQWGNQFERVAQLVYEKLHHVDLLEFGLLFDSDPGNSWIGASPDGIRSDGKTLLEIKCPLIRNVGDPIAINYWAQVMWQMQTCKIDYTHFMDCQINHYATRRTWLEELNNDIKMETSIWKVNDAHHEQSRPTSFANQEGFTLKYGAIVEVRTYDIYDRLIETSYIYPKLIHDNVEEIDEWVKQTVQDVEKDPLKQARIVYYKLDKLVIFTVPYSKMWFDRNRERLLRLWNNILDGRKKVEFTDDINGLAKEILAA
jgi:putative phage-type endonuclease